MSVQVSLLENGLHVVTHDMAHLESVALGAWVQAGARSEAPGDHGISHLLEHMAFKGTKKRSAREIAEAIEAAGGEVNAATSVENTAYYVRLLQDDLALGIDVLSDILANSVFEPEELHREKHVIQQEIGAAADMPEDRVFDLFQEAAFPDQAMGRAILDTPESVERFSEDDLRRFLNTHYRGPNMVISAAGRLDHDNVVALARQTFAGFSFEDAPKPDAGRYIGGMKLEDRPLQEAQILIGFGGPSYLSDDLYAGQLLSAILGGGMASRLFQEVRETRGLCYSIYAFQWPFADTGLFGIHAATSREDVGELVPVILDEAMKLSDAVDETELQRAKTQMRAGLLMTLESPAARAGQMARHMQIYGRPMSLDDIVARIEAVTSADIEALAQKILSSPPTLAAVGPLAGLPDLDVISARLGQSTHQTKSAEHGLFAG